MFIKDLQIVNFRNYSKETLHFKKGVTIIKGANGQGKSNLLEAIYHLCFGRSFRTIKENDLVQWNKPYYYLQGNICFEKKCYKIETGYEAQNSRKIVKINGQLLQKSENINLCPLVFFIPEDLDLIRRGPEERRNFLDREISQLSSFYRECLLRYKRALRQKNSLLKISKIRKNRLNKELLIPWNKQIIYYGSRIFQQRARLISTWGKLASDNFAKLFDKEIMYENDIDDHKMHDNNEEQPLNKEENNLHLSLEYRPGILEIAFAENALFEIEKEMQLQVETAQEEEEERGFSIVGVHKDDFVFLLGGKESKRFASHGQQRSAIICLKAAQIQFYSRNFEKPIFMLDDIFSELDEKRRRQSFVLFQEAEQVFLTMPNYESLQKDIYGQPFSLFDVKNGKAEIIEND